MLKIAIDLGTAVTKIYKAGSGIVLSEATCIAVNETTKETEAYGNEAKEMLGRAASKTSVHFPVCEGEIVNVAYAVDLLEEFFRKIGLKNKQAIEALFVVPCGIPSKVKEQYFTVCDELDISGIHFVEAPCLAAVGSDVPLSSSNPAFVINIGAGVTGIGVLSSTGMIAGISANLGGNNMDAHIVDSVAEKCALKIGALTAEKIKNTVGSLVEGDNQSMVVNGSEMKTGKPESIVVSVPSVLYPICSYLDKIIEYAVMLLRKLPAEVSASICCRGLYLSGGVANIPGIGDYFSQKLEMPVRVSEEPQMAVVLGAGRMISDGRMLEQFEIAMK